MNEQDLNKDMVELLNTTFSREGMNGWSKSVYKGTTCGAHISYPSETSIALGSIVEGCDYGAETVVLEWPFTDEVIWSTLTDIEEECEMIWNSTHGCPDCFDISDDEPSPINQNCSSCQGEGLIL